MPVAKPELREQDISISLGKELRPTGFPLSSSCYHCGETCPEEPISFDEKNFCCVGCKTVYEILNSNGLCRYYEIDPNAGVSLRGRAQAEYAFLDEPEVRERLIAFSNGQRTRVTFYLPQVHCASCIWLLENLYQLSPGVLESKVNFLKKEIYLTYSENNTSLRKVVELLASIGYAPAIQLADLDKEEKPVIDRPFFYKLGVAGFAFGNIMLLSFPEYLGLDEQLDPGFFQIFGYLNILLALPLVFYSGRGYLQSAWLGLKQRSLNLDVPISLGILALFGRSVYEILSHTGAGYLDSLAGLIFFMLSGKWFQQRTYHNISFERDYKSYFPIAARRKTPEGETSVSLDRLEPGDVLSIHHQELVPADSVLLHGEGLIDYSFVTGEAQPVELKTGEKIYAGGRQVGGAIEVSLTRKVSQSYLTQLWNDEAFTKKQESGAGRLADRVGKYFTIVILLIAFASAAYWAPRDVATAVNAFTAVLIIACPCAVALAIPFIFGNAVRVLGRNRFFLKNTRVIEGLHAFTATVFDKTGTITQRHDGAVHFEGEALSSTERQILLALTAGSAHPASRQINRFLDAQEKNPEVLPLKVQDWQEVVGKGVQGIVCQKLVRVGSRAFMDEFLQEQCPDDRGVYVQINHEIRGCFQIDQLFRTGTWQVLDEVKQRGPVYLLSGDNDRERPMLEPLFGASESLRFRQSPHDKLAFIKKLQEQRQEVLMLGDGLNDAGALQASNIGIVVAENTNNFTPACDAILDAGRFSDLPLFIRYARRSIYLVYGAYAFAFSYNVVGLSFAVQGILSPIVAAILMPLSSISIVLLGMLGSNFMARKMGL